MIRHANVPAALIAALLIAALLIAAPAGAETIAFTGGTIHPASGPAIANGTVVVRDGRIEAVGAGVPVPADATVIAITGKHLYPGLVSAYSVLGLTEIGSVSGSTDWQETGTTNPNVRAEVQINPETDLIPVTRINGVTSAHIMPRGGALNGTSAIIHLDGWTWEDMTVRSPVGMLVQWPNLTPNRAWWETRSDEEQAKQREASIQAIVNAFEDARAYWKARDAMGTRGVPRHDGDVKWDAMRKALKGEIPVIFTASALNQIRSVLRFVDDQKLPRVILVSSGDAALVADELKQRNIAVVCSDILAVPSRRHEPYDHRFTAPERLRAAGLAWCIADGGGTDDAANGRNLPYHAAMAAAFGLPRDEALRAVTLYPARILGVADQIGSIEKGKIADLVVANGDLLEIATQVEQVYIKGKPIPMDSRQTRLFKKYDARPRNVISGTPGRNAPSQGK